MQEWLSELSASAEGDMAMIVANAAVELPSDERGKLALLMACQMIIWQKEMNGEPVEEDLAQLQRLRDQLLE